MFTKQSLCIGINAYVPSYLTLQPCINDATDLSHSLRSIGFQTHHATECDLNTMKAATQRFVNCIEPGAVVLFYFSGHGVQYNGNNYLIPKDASGICANNIKSTAIDAQRLISSMYSKSPRLIICILDCCRTDPPTNPLPDGKALKRALSGTKGGLTPMQAPPSTIIVYACAADDTASPRSRNGRNSLYTYNLLRHIRTPNVDIETILKYAAADVQQESDNEQIPYRYSSCNEIIYLASNKKHVEILPSPYMQAVFIACKFFFLSMDSKYIVF